ncbi:N-acetylmuramoyl-L-alanine amidase [Nitratireductor sp. ZSWI3]|uniref:N-acetylmuramoyl-L-alanine amidase n=1 Tax=Nitratireductor sp. ZSWI3 TaxID=2966359 RepID=UPI00214F852F|nr:N-acetylmuramoyl-L-alanine amidase [Nitratireductor sp. ZSWI3]MCR4266061.1 N-acetylmuramoyl-L-alanine amidase [Nitratireductor sp. ZSWI3]
MSGAGGFAADHAGAAVCPSPNFGERRDGRRPDALVLHYTGMETGEGAQAWLCNPESEVSCHYLVHEDGRVVQMVREADRAWHAGKGSWGGLDDVNSFSIGIEIANGGHFLGFPDYPAVQIEAVIALAADICRRHGIAPERVLAHSDVAPGRKIDPGEKFPWDALAAAGVGHFVEPMPPVAGRILEPSEEGVAVVALQRMLARYGYGIAATGTYDAMTATVVREFQRHFRPLLVDGLADVSTCSTLRALLDALPLDSRRR